MLCFRRADIVENEKLVTPTRRSKQSILHRLDAEVNRELTAAHNQDVKRALFLGTGESGKSTVFKQMRINHGDHFTQFEKVQFSKLIWADTLRSMRGLVYLAETRNLKVPAKLHDSYQTLLGLDVTRGVIVQSETDPDARRFLEQHVPPSPGGKPDPLSPSMSTISEEDMRPRCTHPKYMKATREQIAQAVYLLWTEWPELRELSMPAILESNGPYFFAKILEYSRPDYQASAADIVNARLKTTGIVETTFDIRGSKLAVIDVGGQRIERTKWVHCFDDVTCVLFVVAVSEFDLTLREDDQVNRLEESLEVFDQCVNSKWLHDKPVTLFLNKMDILESKLAYCSFKKHHPNFQGDEQNPEQVVDYIEGLFRARMKSQGAAYRGLYTHRTCATDIKSMKFVVEAVTDMVFVKNMQWAGLV
ncbi:Guanine nucleotide-binding protein alpha-1 subunit [Wickerhamiella sorbophila]|uniref:Guanine nucleotide-binding protein alpha-1 subunit n=1 Tax=Wickerhamiella sorbophila TaxID=45607 RepID=A0A2T0FPU3_9ASCO|nr:Guanine nucleotide-binding protein alpha-1 subunit [Wickerhamiella sorbophila]PRT57000.1 Guanine nucleotide-binding protein alpha-1 subunit [Wickerhamiella sorbophila]